MKHDLLSFSFAMDGAMKQVILGSFPMLSFGYRVSIMSPFSPFRSPQVTWIHAYLSDFVKTWPLGFRLAPGEARVQASPASKIVGGLASWSVQLHSPGTALTAGGWIRPGGQN